MSSPNPSLRPTREGPLLVLALALVLSAYVPLSQLFSPSADEAETLRSTTGRLRHIFLGPEQVGCYVCFIWGVFILLSRYLEVRRQRRAFGLDLLPTEEGGASCRRTLGRCSARWSR